MTCQRCTGLMLPDRFMRHEWKAWYCVLCGACWWPNRAMPLAIVEPSPLSHHPLVNKRGRPPMTDDQRMAHREYMRVYMQQYRRRKRAAARG